MSITAQYILIQVINGLAIGSIYALLAIGMNIIYGMLRLINFAHGAVIMVGSYVFLISVMGLGIASYLALPLAIGVGALIGILLELTAYRFLRGKPEVSMLITSLGAYIFIENLVRVLLTSQPRPFPVIPQLNILYNIGGTIVRVVDLLTISSGIFITLGLIALTKKTRVGIAIKATAENVHAASMIGINVDRIITLSFMLASAIAAYTGFIWGVKFGQIDPGMGFLIGVKAFVAIVVGGIGSIAGAVLGGYIVGLSETLSIGLLPPAYSGYRDGIVFLILILALLIRPYGILGRREEIRA